MGKSTIVTVTATPSVILRHAIELAKKRAGEDTFDRQARTLDELGYAIVPKGDEAATGPIAVELPEPDGLEPTEDDDGGSGGVPTWALSSGVLLRDAVQAWPDGVDFDGDLVADEHLVVLENDVLRVLAAIATHRRATRRAARTEARAPEAADGG